MATNTRIGYVWGILSVITVISWLLGHSDTGGQIVASAPITIAVLTMGLIKTRLILQNFAEVHTAPRWLRFSTDIWLVVFWGTVLVMYLY
ncbi:cytochrome C oxidase subunit IV family protein [Nocardia sp. NPDC049737]